MDQLSLHAKDAFRTAVSYPYNILFGTVAFGTTIYLMKKYFGGGVCHSKTVLTGKTAIITGANTGIGLETAIDFAKRGCRVILACRNVEKGQAAVEKVKERANVSEDVIFVQLDLASLQSVRKFAAEILEGEAHIDLLINNAGVMMSPYTLTNDGFELQFGVNHLAHFLLANLLLECMKESPEARIVNLSSLGHRFGKINFDDLKSERSYNPLTAYGQSKLANILFTYQLAKRLEGTSVSTYSVHPGSVRTELGRHINFFIRYFLYYPLKWVFAKSPWQGAQTTIHCAVSDEVVGLSGRYFADCKVKKPSNPDAFDDGIAERLWDASAQLVGLE